MLEELENDQENLNLDIKDDVQKEDYVNIEFDKCGNILIVVLTVFEMFDQEDVILVIIDLFFEDFVLYGLLVFNEIDIIVFLSDLESFFCFSDIFVLVDLFSDLIVINLTVGFFQQFVVLISFVLLCVLIYV